MIDGVRDELQPAKIVKRLDDAQPGSYFSIQEEKLPIAPLGARRGAMGFEVCVVAVVLGVLLWYFAT